MNTSPRSRDSACAWAAASASVSPCSTTARAPGGGARHLGRGRELRHHDGGLDAASTGMPRDRLGVVAGRHRDHAARRARLGVSSASRFAAPRSLNAPVACRLSSLSTTSAPVARRDAASVRRRACAARGPRSARRPRAHRRA